jgi:inner membrane protein involved in colicin E2 resistance
LKVAYLYATYSCGYAISIYLVGNLKEKINGIRMIKYGYLL